MSDKHWDKMMTDWQSCKIAKIGDQKELEDIQLLEVKTRKKARSMNFFMWADIIGAGAVSVVFIYLFTQDIDLYKQILFGGALLIILPSAFLSIWLRRGAWETTGNDTKAYIILALKRNLSAINLARVNTVAALLAGPFFIAVLLWRGLTHPDNIEWPLNRYFFGSLLQFALFSAMYFGSKLYKKRKQFERLKLETMLAEIISESNDD